MKKMLFLAVFSAFLLINQTTHAQDIMWAELTDSVQLPDGVRYFEGTRSSPAFKGWYFEVDTNNEDIALVPIWQQEVPKPSPSLPLVKMHMLPSMAGTLEEESVTQR